MIRFLAETLGEQPMEPGIGALYAIVSIVMVFAILLIIIGVTNLVFKLTGLWDMKKELDKAKKEKNAPVVEQSNVVSTPKGPVVIADDDMMAAVLVATIDYQNEIKKDVRLVSVKEVK